MNQVELGARVQLESVLSDLGKLTKKLQDVQVGFKDTGKTVSEGIKEKTKETETFLTKLRTFSSKVKDQIKEDFKALLSIEALGQSLKLSEQFRGSIKQAVILNDTIRKIGGTLGLSKDQFQDFQSSMMKGLGDLGISTQAGTEALKELSKTPVKGKEALIEYSKAAGMLASITNEPGSEGAIAGSLARIIQQKGGNPNDIRMMRSAAEDIKRVADVTGRGAADIAKDMESTFSSMSDDFRKTIGTAELANIMGAASVAGPGSVQFIKDYLSLDEAQRAGKATMGMGNLIKGGKLDIGELTKFKKALDDLTKATGGNRRMAMKHMILTENDEVAESTLRLVDSLKEVEEAQNKTIEASRDLSEAMYDGMGLSEAFGANINKLKGAFSSGTQSVQNFVGDVAEGLGFSGAAKSIKQLGLGTVSGGLGKASQSTVGATGVVAGGALLAALLAGGALRGIGGILGKSGALGGLAGIAVKGAAAEAITGKETQPVYVVNAAEIAGGGIAGSLVGGKIGGTLGKIAGVLPMLARAGLAAGAVGAAGYAGFKLGENVINPALDKFTTGKTSEGYEGNIVEQLFFKLDKLIGGENATNFMQNQAVQLKIESKIPNIKVTPRESRGGSY